MGRHLEVSTWSLLPTVVKLHACSFPQEYWKVLAASVHTHTEERTTNYLLAVRNVYKIDNDQNNNITKQCFVFVHKHKCFKSQKLISEYENIT